MLKRMPCCAASSPSITMSEVFQMAAQSSFWASKSLLKASVPLVRRNRALNCSLLWVYPPNFSRRKVLFWGTFSSYCNPIYVSVSFFWGDNISSLPLIKHLFTIKVRTLKWVFLVFAVIRAMSLVFDTSVVSQKSSSQLLSLFLMPLSK